MSDAREAKMEEVIKYREHLSAGSRQMLINALKRTIRDTAKHMVMLDPEALQQITQELRISGQQLRIVG
jgi:curli biogenesis system outer membrane secretion channel CsgG